VPAATVTRPELLSHGSDEAFRGFIHDFLAFAARVSEVRAGFGEFLGMSGSAYTTLIAIAHLQGRDGVGVNEVADHLHLSGAFVTIEVGKLVKEGTTGKARAMLARLIAVQAPVNDALFGCLTAKEFQVMKGILARLVPCGDDALALLGFHARPARAAAR
jgi:DNA-binding MarR family transcriptional regulator